MPSLAHNRQGGFEQHLRGQIIRDRQRRPARYGQIKHSLAKSMLQRIPITYRDMISDAWISANEVADDFCNDRGDRLGYTDRKVTMRRIRPLHNFGNTQLYFVENDARAI